MSYEQASREAERLIARQGWFQSFDRLAALREIMRRELDRMQVAQASTVRTIDVPDGCRIEELWDGSLRVTRGEAALTITREEIEDNLGPVRMREWFAALTEKAA
jgi:hypothetical protein